MLKRAIVFLLLLPNIVFAFVCAELPLSQYAMMENVKIVTFNVVDTKASTDSGHGYIDVEITQEFISNEITSPPIRIKPSVFDKVSLNKFTKNTEWLAALEKSGDFYIISGCAPVLPVENGFIAGNTGINILDNSKNKVPLEAFKLAINAYQQGIISADTVCKSANSYCTETKAIYDRETGILNLPTVQYSQFGIPLYVQAKMQKISDGPMKFTVTEIK